MLINRITYNKIITKIGSLYIYTYNLSFDLVCDDGDKGEEDRERSELICRFFFF